MADKAACPCNFTSRNDERKAKAEFLRRYGEDLPEDAIQKMVSDEHIDQWEILCDCGNPDNIVAGVHYEDNDWYLCTVKGLAVDPDLRGTRLGSKVMDGIMTKVKADPSCLVLAADITVDNDRSQVLFRNRGFEPVSTFCWKAGEKPADILHLVRFKPDDNQTCPAP